MSSDQTNRAHLLDLAETLKPPLAQSIRTPVRTVTVEPSADAPLGYTAVPASLDETSVLRKGDTIIFDFGRHCVGYLSFSLNYVGRQCDAPTRLRVVFGEVLPDVAESFEPYKAWLSQAWLPDELLNVDFLPQAVRLPRRHAFRYVKIEVIATSIHFGVLFQSVAAHTVTSAPLDDPPPLEFTPSVPIEPGDHRAFREIDTVAIATLRSCMQTVYEDGPRRDMRLWVGDLRLQALVNYATFGDLSLVKRCLSLFAALPFDDDGRVCACVYEKPAPRPGGDFILDYSLLFGVTVAEYVQESGDEAFGRDVWPVVLKQAELVAKYIDDQGIFVDPKDGTWIFIDWHDDLDRSTPMQGIVIYSLQQIHELASRLSIVPPPSISLTSGSTHTLPSLIQLMTSASRQHLYDAERGVFISGPARQISLASQAWMCIAGVPENPYIGTRAMEAVAADHTSIRPNTPYMWHYVVEAYLINGMVKQALTLVKDYWGSMVAAGADTFFEAWDPSRPRFSPYGDIHVNSHCHAWSCTPSLIFRRRLGMT